MKLFTYRITIQTLALLPLFFGSIAFVDADASRGANLRRRVALTSDTLPRKVVVDKPETGSK